MIAEEFELTEETTFDQFEDWQDALDALEEFADDQGEYGRMIATYAEEYMGEANVKGNKATFEDVINEANGRYAGEGTIKSVISEMYDRDDLPDWAEASFDAIMEDKAIDAEDEGMREYNGYVFNA